MRHAGKRQSTLDRIKGCLPEDGKTRKTLVTVGALALAAGVFIAKSGCEDGAVDDAYTGIQQPLDTNEHPNDSLRQPVTVDDSDGNKTPEEVIVVDRGSQVTTCEIIQGQGAIDGKVKCPHPDRIIKPSFQDVQGAQQVIGSNPDTQFFVNVDIDQPTTA
jgi:hypothetical protein